MLTEDDLYTRVSPKNPLPFNIVDESCPVCMEALEELNRFIPDSVPRNKIMVCLDKDTAGRGWHIQGYKLPHQDYVDLSNVENNGLNGKVKEVR